MTRQSATAAGAEMDDAPALIEQEYPQWHVWRSQAGRWWATRLGHMRPPADRDPGYPEFAMTLDADTAARLRQALASRLRRFGWRPPAPPAGQTSAGGPNQHLRPADKPFRAFPAS